MKDWQEFCYGAGKKSISCSSTRCQNRLLSMISKSPCFNCDKNAQSTKYVSCTNKLNNNKISILTCSGCFEKNGTILQEEFMAQYHKENEVSKRITEILSMTPEESTEEIFMNGVEVNMELVQINNGINYDAKSSENVPPQSRTFLMNGKTINVFLSDGVCNKCGSYSKGDGVMIQFGVQGILRYIYTCRTCCISASNSVELPDDCDCYLCLQKTEKSSSFKILDQNGDVRIMYILCCSPKCLSSCYQSICRTSLASEFTICDVCGSNDVCLLTKCYKCAKHRWCSPTCLITHNARHNKHIVLNDDKKEPCSQKPVRTSDNAGDDIKLLDAMRKDRKIESEERQLQLALLNNVAYIGRCRHRSCLKRIWGDDVTKYITVKCSTGCDFMYHHQCYYSLVRHKQLPKHGDICMTPDCDGSLSSICSMQSGKLLRILVAAENHQEFTMENDLKISTDLFDDQTVYEDIEGVEDTDPVEGEPSAEYVDTRAEYINTRGEHIVMSEEYNDTSGEYIDTSGKYIDMSGENDVTSATEQKKLLLFMPVKPLVRQDTLETTVSRERKKKEKNKKKKKNKKNKKNANVNFVDLQRVFNPDQT